MAEWDAWDAFLCEADRTDKQADDFADRTFVKTNEQIIGVPAMNDSDALAAIDYLISNGRAGFLIDLEHDETAGWLVQTVRDYLAGRIS